VFLCLPNNYLAVVASNAEATTQTNGLNMPGFGLGMNIRPKLKNNMHR